MQVLDDAIYIKFRDGDLLIVSTEGISIVASRDTQDLLLSLMLSKPKRSYLRHRDAIARVIARPGQFDLVSVEEGLAIKSKNVFLMFNADAVVMAPTISMPVGAMEYLQLLHGQISTLLMGQR